MYYINNIYFSDKLQFAIRYICNPVHRAECSVNITQATLALISG